MQRARYANFRHLRGSGWSIALPIAGLIGMIAGVIFDSVPVGVAVGVGVSACGLLVLSLGYLLGDLWEGYWMVPIGLGGIEVSLVAMVLGGRWLLVLVVTGMAILLIACMVAIGRNADGEGGWRQLLRHFGQSLIPGKYSGYSG